jgi:hypothetical protein
MAAFDSTVWFRENMAEYLTVIKAELAAVGEVTGQLLGTEATFADLPVVDTKGDAANAGDYAILTADDGANESGIYVYDGAAFSFAMDLTSFDEVINGLIATPIEVDEGSAPDKFASVAILATKYAKINGDVANSFAVAPADIATDNAINANQMAGSVTAVEATADWAAA